MQTGATQAIPLVKAAELMAVTSHIQFLKQILAQSLLDMKSWDFFVTIGGVYAGSIVLETRLQSAGSSEEQIASQMNPIEDDLRTWHPDGVQALTDCRNFVERNLPNLRFESETHLSVGDAIGAWILWNLSGQLPEGEDEARLASQVGRFLFLTFEHWWD